jgi:PAS domain S-box-containing protein
MGMRLLYLQPAVILTLIKAIVIPMAWQTNLYAIPFILTIFPLGYCAQLAWRRRSKLPERLFLALIATILWLTIIYTLRLVSSDPTLILWLVKMEYPANLLSVVLWLLFILAYLGYEKLITWRTIGLLSIFPLTYMALVWTNEYHHLHWAYTGVKLVDSLVIFNYRYSYSPAFWLSIGYIYLLLLAATVIIVRKLANGAAVFRQQSRALLMATLLPWASAVIDITKLNPFPFLDMNVLSLVVSSGLLAWSLFRYRLLDLAPAAHDMVVNSMSDAVLVLDTDQRIVEANPAAAALLAAPGQQLIGQSAQTIFAGLSTKLSAPLNGAEVNEEVTVQHGDESRWLDIRITPLHNQGGSNRGRVVMVRDITKQKQAEQQAVQLALEQQKVRLLREFIDITSHDLNTPLTTLRIATDLLRVYATRLPAPIATLRTILRDTAVEETLTQLEKLVQSVVTNGDRINESTLRLQRLVGEMLEMVRLDKQVPLTLRDASLNEVARAVLQQAEANARTQGLALCYEPDPTLPPIPLDEQEIQRAIHHLVGNAITYSPAGGTVRLRTRQQDGQAILEVSDTGIGIPAEELPFIFERFYRVDKARGAQTGGMGLGLAIVKNVVEAHHGHVEAESTPGSGSTFRICLPLTHS